MIFNLEEIKNIGKSQKGGVFILMSFFILIITLLISLSIATLVINQVKMSKNVEDSFMAYYAAEAGLEEMSYYRSQYFIDPATYAQLPPDSDPSYLCPTKKPYGNASFCITIDGAGFQRPTGSINDIESYGFYRSTMRAVGNFFASP